MYIPKVVSQDKQDHIDRLELNRIKNMFTDQDPEDMLELAQLYVDTKEFQRSRDYCYSYLKICQKSELPINNSVYKYLAYAFLSEGKKWEALSYFQKHIKNNRAPDADAEKNYRELRAELYPSTPQSPNS